MSSKLIFLEKLDKRNYSSIAVIPKEKLKELNTYIEGVFNIPKLSDFIQEFAKLCALIKSWHTNISQGIDVKEDKSGGKTYVVDISNLPNNIVVVAFRQSLWVNPKESENKQITAEIIIVDSSGRKVIRRVATLRGKEILSDLIMRE